MPNKPSHRKQLIPQRLDKVIDSWLADLRYLNRSPRTIDFYREFTNPFLEAIGGHVQVHTIRPDAIRKYLDRPATIYVKSSRYRALRAFFHWCERNSYLEDSPLVQEAPSVEDRVKETFSQDHYDRMRHACTGRYRLRDRAILMVFWDTGCRLSEMERMKTADVDLDARLIKLEGKGEKGKTKKERRVVFTRETRAALWEYAKTRHDDLEYMWQSNKGDRLTRRGIHLMIRRLIQKAGIPFQASTHTFRHSMAVRLLAAGVSPLDVQYILGHKSLEMVRRYSRHQQEERALAAMRRHQDGL